jgi:hypothetical protein
MNTNNNNDITTSKRNYTKRKGNIDLEVEAQQNKRKYYMNYYKDKKADVDKYKKHLEYMRNYNKNRTQKTHELLEKIKLLEQEREQLNMIKTLLNK